MSGAAPAFAAVLLEALNNGASPPAFALFFASAASELPDLSPIIDFGKTFSICFRAASGRAFPLNAT
jgi:hypothetical protein